MAEHAVLLPCGTLTFYYRIKDATGGKYRTRLSWWSTPSGTDGNNVSMLTLRRHHHWLTVFELINLCAGASAELGLHSDTVAEMCQEPVSAHRATEVVR
jgi:hypothetical protein